MNERDPGFWADVLNGLKNAWPQILGSMMAGLICYGRLIYDGVERKNRWIELPHVAHPRLHDAVGPVRMIT
ncbi:phage holin family protein, partial [Pseudonocardia alni]|uniref:phage holin family protein n=1 Tax=Pseudonocardia alni TaxID=33907 RepID=UPI00332C7B57